MRQLVYCFDIDGTLCTNNEGRYLEAEPVEGRVDHVNSLYDTGHVIKLFTARGATTGMDWRSQTERQLAEWGLRYHELIFGKPHADFFIDDKAVHSDAYDWTSRPCLPRSLRRVITRSSSTRSTCRPRSASGRFSSRCM